MDVFLLHSPSKKFIYNVATDNQLFIDENGNYWCAINHADEDEFEYFGHTLKKVPKDHIISQEM